MEYELQLFLSNSLLVNDEREQYSEQTTQRGTRAL